MLPRKKQGFWQTKTWSIDVNCPSYILYIYTVEIYVYIYIILFTIQVMKMILYPHSIHHYVSLVDFVPCMVIEMVIDLDNERF